MLKIKQNIIKKVNVKNTMIVIIMSFAMLMFTTVNADTVSGHYTYSDNSDGTITIKKYDGTAADNLEIPSEIDGKKVTVIGVSAFKDCTNLTGDLVIPDGVITIGWHAFSGCSSLTGELDIPNSVTSIGLRAFSGCSGLTGDLIIPNSVTTIGNYAFAYCKGFNGNLKMYNSITSIGSYAFYGCSGLTGNLSIPYSVKSIEPGTFCDCSGFDGSLKIPPTITSIGSYAFENCSGLIGEWYIPDSVTFVGKSAFAGCSGLTGELYISENVTSIGNGAFYNCNGLTEINVSSNNESYTSIEGVLFNKDKTELITYPKGKKADNYIIPDSTIIIKEKAFAYSSGLTGNLTIPNSVTTIGERAFYECTGLNGILTMGTSVESIGDYAFYKCNGLVGNLIFGHGLNSVGDAAFQDCSGLSGNLVIPDSVTNIGWQAFLNSDVVIFYANAPITGWGAFGLCDLIYYRKGTTGFTSENNYPTNKLVEYEYKFSDEEITLNYKTDEKRVEIVYDYEFMKDFVKSISYSSSNIDVVKVGSLGNLTPVKNGTADIIANIILIDGSEVQLTKSVNVDFKATSISLNKTNYTFNEYEVLSLSATVLPDYTNNKSVTWKSSNTKVAVVNGEGKVSPVGEGTAIITATTNDGTNLSAECNITSKVKYLLGDINKDGVVNINDVNYALRGFTKGTLTDEEKQIGDVNSDGMFNINDINQMLRNLVGKK